MLVRQRLVTASLMILFSSRHMRVRVRTPEAHPVNGLINLTLLAEGPQACSRRLNLMHSMNPPSSATANGQRVHGVVSDITKLNGPLV